MGGILVIFNSLLYIIALYRHWSITRKTDVGFVLLLIYAFIAVFCAANYFRVPKMFPGLSLWPFLYLFIVLMLFMRPFLTYSSVIIGKVDFGNGKLLKRFSQLYVFLGIITVYYGYNDIYTTLFLSDWKDVIGESFQEGGHELYRNQVERLSKIFCGYTSFLALIASFYYMSSSQRKYLLSSCLLFLFLFTILYTGIVNGSRGVFVGVIFQVLVGYALFKDHIVPKVKKILGLSGIIAISLIISILAALTITRFSKVNWDADYDDPISSAFSYLGQSMLVFNDGIADSIQKYMWGDFMFGTNAGLYKNGLDAVLGTHCDSLFFTFVGCLYLDFGPIFTLFLALLIPQLICKSIEKKKVKISSLFLYVYFATFIASGVFVVGSGYYIVLLMTFLIYLVLYRLEKLEVFKKK